MLDQHGHEAFVRAVNRTVNHDRPMGVAVLADVLELEPLGLLKIQLRRVELPGSPERVLDVDVDLRTVERALAVLDLVRQFVLLESRLEVRFGTFPYRRIANGFGRMLSCYCKNMGAARPEEKG